MKYTPEEVMQFVEEEDVKFIRLAFCDVYGKQKNISIMPPELSRAFRQGISFDASVMTGEDLGTESDLLLHPDPDTLSILPWRPDHGKVIRMYCSISYLDGRPFEGDARSLLQKAVQDAKKAGLSFCFGTPMAFYLFKLDDEGHPTKDPYDFGSYLDIAPLDKGENIRREICLTLEQMGIYPETSHHEYGPGQNEISFHYMDPVSAADNAVTFRSVVQTVAARNGLYADFSPKPLEHLPGNGFHINLSVNDADADNKLRYTTAGILANIASMTAFMNPLPESYSRLGHHIVSRYICWSYHNRTAMIRIPMNGRTKHIEIRTPDSAANPYIAFTLLIHAAIDGCRNKLPLMDETKENLVKAAPAVLKDFTALPDCLDNAKKEAAYSEFIRESLPDVLIQAYCK